MEIRCFRQVDGEKEFTGILTAYDAETVTIQENEENRRTLERANIALIRLAFDF